MTDEESRRRFAALALPHLDAAYNLARWLTRNDADAQDVVQDAFLRAMRYFGSFRGEHVRPWLLQIVRHSCYQWIHKNRPAEQVALGEFDAAASDPAAPAADEPSAVALRNADRAAINHALAELPVVYREVLVLREMEELSYRDIARIADVPIGTVMSRLSRARSLMRDALAPGSRPVLRTVARSVKRGETS